VSGWGTSLEEAAEHVRAVRDQPGFVAFARVVGLRINNGQSLEALHMLEAVGCTPKLAHEIVEGWNVNKAWHLSAVECKKLGISRVELSAIRFSKFIDEIELYNWGPLLKKAARAAMQRKANEANQSLGSQD
jgi:hypothetical protein